MNRRKFLTRTGLGSLALASLPVLATPALAHHRQTHFRFVSNSHAATLDGVAHVFLMNGDGTITRSHVQGGGSFAHIDNASPVPKTILASGTWETKRLLSFNLLGTYGVLAAGLLEMEVRLIQLIPSRKVMPATLMVVCNLGPAGLATPGKEEGFYLTIPGTPFVEGGAGGPFEPFEPPLGVTIFTTSEEEEDDDDDSIDAGIA